MGGQDSLYSPRTFLTSHDKHWFYSQERKGESTSSGPPAARGPPSPAHPVCAPLPRPSSSRPSLTRPPLRGLWIPAPPASRPVPRLLHHFRSVSGLGGPGLPCLPVSSRSSCSPGCVRQLRSLSAATSLALLVAVPPPRPLLRWAGPRLSPPALLTPCSAAPVRGPGPACLVSGLLYTLPTPTSPATAQTRPPKAPDVSPQHP